MKYGIWCRVEGGVTGTREAWMKNGGVDRVFDTEVEAAAVAASLNKAMNGPWAKAKFTYTVKERDAKG